MRRVPHALDVRYWHKADIPWRAVNVRFRGGLKLARLPRRE